MVIALLSGSVSCLTKSNLVLLTNVSNNMINFSEFGLSEKQAEAILAITLRRLSALEVPFCSHLFFLSSFLKFEVVSLNMFKPRFCLHIYAAEKVY